MASWLQKASSLIDSIEQGVNDQLKSKVGIGGGDDDADHDTLTAEDPHDEEAESEEEDSDDEEIQEVSPDDDEHETEHKVDDTEHDTTAKASTNVDPVAAHSIDSKPPSQSTQPADPSSTITITAKSAVSEPPHKSVSPNEPILDTKSANPLPNGTANITTPKSTNADSPKTVSLDSITESVPTPTQPPPPSQTAAQSSRSKPRKQSKSKSKKSKSKQNKSHSSSSSTNSDYKQLKKQYEGMVKLWNEERANLKKAQHLLRSQKDKFKMEQTDINESHLAKVQKITAEFELQIALKNKSIASLEEALLKVKEERNDKIEDKDRLNEVIGELKAEREEILKEKALITKEKQEQIELIRREFEVERKGWEKERKILTKNFERENFLENENQEFTSALARTQSALQQKELEHSRIAGELRWVKQDKEEMAKTNAILKEENVSLNGSVDELKEKIRCKNQEIMQLKEEQMDAVQFEQDRYHKLQIEHERLKEEQERTASDQMATLHIRNSQRGDFEHRIETLTADLLEKQTELDRVISQRNEYKIKLSKLEEAMNTNSSDIVVGMDSKGRLKDLEMGLVAKRARRKEHPTGRLPRKNYTKWKTINDGIGIFDKIGLEFAHILRNKPWVRLLILFYVLILHLWCFLVLHFSLNFEQDDSH